MERNWSECTSILKVTIAFEPHGESSWSPHLSCNLDPVYSAPRSFPTKPFTLSPRVLCPLYSAPPRLRGLGSIAPCWVDSLRRGLTPTGVSKKLSLAALKDQWVGCGTSMFSLGLGNTASFDLSSHPWNFCLIQ